MNRRNSWPLGPSCVLRKATEWAAAAAILGGCAVTWQTQEPVEPSTYTTSGAVIERTIGKLRTVLVIAVDLPPPERCSMESTEWRIVEDPAGVGPLLASRGYEITPGTEERLRSLTQSDPYERVGVLLTALRNYSPGRPISRDVLEAARGFGKAAGTDAVMIFERFSFCSDWNEGVSFDRVLLGIYTFGLSEVIMGVGPKPRRTDHARLHALMFETASGRAVWYSCPRCSPTTQVSSEKYKSDTAKELIGDLDTAVPKLLTR